MAPVFFLYEETGCMHYRTAWCRKDNAGERLGVWSRSRARRSDGWVSSPPGALGQCARSPLGSCVCVVTNFRGQPRFRSMWERYCTGVSTIIFAVDSGVPLPADKPDTKEGATDGREVTKHQSTSPWLIAAEELHTLLLQPSLTGLPLLVLATKSDLPGHASVREVIDTLCVANLTQKLDNH